MIYSENNMSILRFPVREELVRSECQKTPWLSLNSQFKTGWLATEQHVVVVVFFIFLFAILSVSHLHGDDSSFVFLPHQVITSHLNPTGLLLWMFNCATLKVLYDVILDTGAHTKVQSPGFDWSGSKFTFLWLINKRMPSWIWRRGIPSVFQRTCFSSQDSLRAGITLRDWQTVMWAGM